MAGLFFCLASDTVHGFYFARIQYSPIQALTVAFISSMQLYSPRHKTAHRALQKLFRLFAAFFRCCVAVYPAILHHLRHAGAYHSAVAPPANTRYQRHAGRYTGQHSRPIIIRYIRARRLLLRIHARRCSISQTMPARRGQCLHLYRVSPVACNLAPGQLGTLHPAGQSSGGGAAGGAEPLTATAVSLFGLSPDS